MIEKLDKFDSTEASIYHAEKLYAKVNQLVDAVNVLQAQVAILEEHAHPTAKTPVDPYAEQRKALEQSEICCTEWEKQALDYKAENIALSGDLEHTRKALDVAVDALNTIKGKHDPRCAVYHIDEKTAYDALEQITALEQKDVK